jgi:putative GTP pyrophosphokinase
MPSKAERTEIDALIAHYKANQSTVSHFLQVVLVALKESAALSAQVHSIKSRTKSYRSLRGKLYRKLDKCKEKNKPFKITTANLLFKVNDLAGIRILHLHTRQFTAINKALLAIFKEQKYEVKEGPFARTWDDESRAFFQKQGVKIEKSETLYTSVHYVIESASRTKVTCEIQVRTLMEEVWGEVDHAINYPLKSKSVACREQIKALARSTSAATRLVDSIFASAEDLAKTRRR